MQTGNCTHPSPHFDLLLRLCRQQLLDNLLVSRHDGQVKRGRAALRRRESSKKTDRQTNTHKAGLVLRLTIPLIYLSVFVLLH